MNKEEAKKQIDADDASINGVKLITTCRAKGIIDAIDDYQKVKLPWQPGRTVLTDEQLAAIRMVVREEIERMATEDDDLIDESHEAGFDPYNGI